MTKGLIAGRIRVAWPHRLVVQDAGLSSRKQGFDSPWGYREAPHPGWVGGFVIHVTSMTQHFCESRVIPLQRLRLLTSNLHPADYTPWITLDGVRILHDHLYNTVSHYPKIFPQY